MRRTNILVWYRFLRRYWTVRIDEGAVRLVTNNLLKSIISIAALIGLFKLGQIFVGDYVMEWLTPLLSKPFLMLSLFWTSEAFLGILPPDAFIIWGLQYDWSFFLQYLAILSVLSYTGGMVGHFFGVHVGRSPYINQYLERFYRKYARPINRWGGLIIVVATLTPLPFSIVSIVAGALLYPFRKYALYASVRILRYFIYGWVFWQMNLL